MTIKADQNQRRPAPFMNDFLAAAKVLGSTRPAEGGKREKNTEARIAAICALEKIATRDQQAFALVVETLCGYVRLNACLDDASRPERDAKDIPTDIQTALKAIARRCQVRDPAFSAPVDLSRTDLRGAVLWGAQLEGAILARADLELADLGEANLRGASLMGTNFSRAILWRATLIAAQAWGTSFQKAVLAEANLSDANLAKANLQGAVLTSANLEGAFLLGAQLEGARVEGVSGYEAPEQEMQAESP